MNMNVKNAKLKIPELVKKVEFYEGLRKLFVELAVEIIVGVIRRLIVGGASGRQSIRQAA